MNTGSGIRFKYFASWSAHGAILAALFAGSASAQEIASSPAAGPIAQQAAQTLAYWTPERMSAAIPKPAPVADAASRVAVQSVVSNRGADAYPTVVPGWSPTSGQPQPAPNSRKVFAPGTDEYRSIMAAAQPMAFGSPPSNPVDYPNYGKFQRWTWYANYLIYPTSTIVKMFFSQNGGNYVCSGTVVNRNTVLTAGHCVSDGAGTFSTNILFCPSYFRGAGSGSAHPDRGCWVGGYISTTTDWHNSSDFDRDYACVVTNPTGTTVANNIGNVTGWIGISTNWPRSQQTFATGYPAASPFAGYHIIFTAAVEWYSQGSGGDAAVSKYIGNDMTGGSSGGSWWLNIRHDTFEYPDVDGSSETDPLQTTGAGGPYANGLNSHKRCMSSCFTPPNAGGGIYWAEMGSPDFTSSGGDNRDVLDIHANCAANGGG